MSEASELVSDLLRNAIPVNAVAPPPSFVTREEFDAKIGTLESKIEGEATKTKLWVVVGCMAIIASFGGGYVTLISRIDRISEALPEIAKVQDGRREWIQLQDQRDSQQDAALRRIDSSYQPLPYQASPR